LLFGAVVRLSDTERPHEEKTFDDMFNSFELSIQSASVIDMDGPTELPFRALQLRRAVKKQKQKQHSRT